MISNGNDVHLLRELDGMSMACKLRDADKRLLKIT